MKSEFTYEATFKFDANYNWGTEVAFGINGSTATYPGSYAMGFYYSSGYLYAISNYNYYNSNNGSSYITPGEYYNFRIKKSGSSQRTGSNIYLCRPY
ncbi:MAG: hypothetical protein EOP53_14555 [Sphingobacteriales bacterium]|nr:MAG: hypothetical protein EOP53_14555 [Sphingobacteriales bacterium]